MNRERESLQHRPFMTPIWLSAIGAFLALSFAVFAVWIWGTANSTTVIVIRHAEKESSGAVDPPLSAAGEARAALLASMFGDARVRAVSTRSTCQRPCAIDRPLRRWRRVLGSRRRGAPPMMLKVWRIGHCASTAAGGS